MLHVHMCPVGSFLLVFVYAGTILTTLEWGLFADRLRVDVHRGSQIGVPQQFLLDVQIHTQLSQHVPKGVPYVCGQSGRPPSDHRPAVPPTKRFVRRLCERSVGLKFCLNACFSIGCEQQLTN